MMPMLRAMLTSGGRQPFILRPDSNVTQTNFTGGYAEIDEAVASDADKAYPNTNGTCTLEVGLSNPPAPPIGGTVTVRYRLIKVDTNDGSAQGGGPTPEATLHIYEGATLRASDSARSPSAATGYTWNPDLSAVTDWSNLRLRLTQSTSGGRGQAITWAELEWQP